MAALNPTAAFGRSAAAKYQVIVRVEQKHVYVRMNVRMYGYMNVLLYDGTNVYMYANT